ncbi:MAG TPA: helix-turn-helix transcriptional regulator [Thermoanaerobaculia bacterium]|nr:helix-turn-helix transcriptional regulator [Thermoanaerobaculia bacterium]
MIHDDLAQLRQLLARAVQASGRPVRDLERGIGVGSGSLRRMLSGELNLRVEHLTNLARLLRIPPGDLLAAGCPETTAAARHRLTDWIGPGDSAPSTAPPPAPPSPEELAALIRAAVREELAARQGR